MVRPVRLAASVNPNNFRFSAMVRRALMMSMRLALMIGMICSLAAWAAAPTEYAWQRNAMYVYRVNIESAEEGYQPSLRGDVVYLCRASNPHGFTLRCYNFAVLQRHSKSGRRFPPFGVFQMGWRFFDGKQVGRQTRPPVDVVFRPNGELLARAGVASRMFDLNDPSLLVLDRLGLKTETEWTATETVKIVHERRVSIPGSGRLVRLDKTPLTGALRVKYQRKAGILFQTFALSTRVVPSRVHVQLEGTGRTTFNKAGIPEQFAWEGIITDHDGENERTVPLKISYQLLSGNEAMLVLRPPAPATRSERRPIAAGDLGKLLVNVQQRLTDRRPKALARLVVGDPRGVNPAQRDQVVAALVHILRDSDPFLRRDAARALANWGDAASISALIARLNDPQMTVRWAAIDALGSLRDPRGMEPVAQHLGSGREISAAVNALQFFGRAVPGIEPHLLPLMKNKNSTVRVETARLLAAFGTGKSVLPLALAAKDTDAAVAKAASAALEAIRKRTRPK
jgi:hypothetical protein